jgi:hypothetical protein
MMLCLTMIGPEAMKSSDHGLKTLKPWFEINLSFPSLSWLSLVFITARTIRLTRQLRKTLQECNK